MSECKFCEIVDGAREGTFVYRNDRVAVFHVHQHVFPRFRGDGFGQTFAESYHRISPRSELEAAAEKISRNS